MKERPIVFSGPMVRAILEGRKTQTRRIARGSEQAVECVQMLNRYNVPTGELGVCFHPRVISKQIKCPYGTVGDRLWVRETFYDRGDYGLIGKHRSDRFVFAADKKHPGWRLHHSIHMPRWASRITLEITGVRVERLQSISESDAIAEGAEPELVPPDGGSCPHTEGFRTLWESINGKRAPWAANPWVWVVEFRRVER